jgi:hypothetical protein
MVTAGLRFETGEHSGEYTHSPNGQQGGDRWHRQCSF